MKIDYLNEKRLIVKAETTNIHASSIFNHIIYPLVQKINAGTLYVSNGFANVVAKAHLDDQTIIDTYDALVFGQASKSQGLNRQLDKETSAHLLMFTLEFKKFWLTLEKYAFIEDTLESASNLTSLNNTIHRVVSEQLESIISKLNKEPHHFKQMPFMGANAFLSITTPDYHVPNTYASLNSIPKITQVNFSVPYINRTKSNTRTGLFSHTNQLIDVNSINTSDWLSIPIKVGKLLVLVFFNKKYIHHGVGLLNLFATANEKETSNKRPDALCFFGVKDKAFDGQYHYDETNDLYVGTIYNHSRNDYFGYMKKMILTLHNLYMIKKQVLPIHGAMVTVKLLNGKTRNIVIIGDSGAGKSESLEAFRMIGDALIQDMTIIFDDMGTFSYSENQVVANGTEIGAFVRMDDLDSAYPFENMDNALFLNPERVNARLIVKVTDYETVIKNHAIDMVLYANNYENNDHAIEFFSSWEDAVSVFKKGARVSKGTTSELGMAENFFANPFGPVQNQKITSTLIDDYFKRLFESNVKVGVLYTRLGIEGFEVEGPRKAAESLLKSI